ncbi:MAG: GerMN domain-containing protein, partial [Bacillota bacterium]|nr:GerMN domain-containing protein [Bacillota bacterium]
KEILLYYMSAEGDSLEAERREIPKETGLARATVQQLLSGPRDEDLLPVIPSGISLRSINISGGTCTVDLSAELSDLAAISPAEQELALYSLVNTLSQFDSVDYVQVLINGQKLSEFGGVDASQALAPMDL